MFEKIVEHIKDITGPRFYFLVTLIFLLTTANIFKEPITDYVKVERFSAIQFRECRNVLGLEKELNRISIAYPNVLEYSVYLYQPKDNSSYKKLVLTNSEKAKTSVDLQGIYLKDQPVINEGLKDGDYLMVEDIALKAREPGAHYINTLKALNIDNVLFYKLQIKGKIVGEIVMSFAKTPTAVELDMIMRELSPLLHIYIM